MKNFILNRLILFLIVTSFASACRKQTTLDETTVSLLNSKWLLTKEILYYPNGTISINTRNSIFTFEADHDLIIFHPDSYIQIENGKWSATIEKITTDINNNNSLQYHRSYRILMRNDSFLRVSVEGLSFSGSGGNTYDVQYELVKL